MIKKWTLLLLLAIVAMAFSKDNKGSRHNYPQDYFASPVKHTIRLSGSFGELRPNHFHSGIDIKSSSGSSGDKLYATAEGSVSRIKVQAGGYGNALYIDHPNGFTSVYAHLDNFTDEVKQYVKEQQTLKESFEVDLSVPSGKFIFNKGQYIGTMGNTGMSFGPHLHFEIRHTSSEKPINPRLFGIAVADNISPILSKIKAYQLNDKHEVLGDEVRNVKKGKSGTYYVGGDTITVAAWRMALGLNGYDRANGSSNFLGLYGIKLFLDDSLYHHAEVEKFSFDDTRYLNAHIDYQEKLLRKRYFHRLYKMPGNQLDIYPKSDNRGVFKIFKDKARKVEIIAYDVNGNESKLRFWVKRAGDVSTPPSSTFNYLLPHDEPSIIDNGQLRLSFEAGSFYENLYLSLRSSQDNSNGVYSDVHHIGDYKIPVHRFFEVGIRPREIPEALRSKAFVAYCQNGKTPKNCGGTWNGNRLVGKARSLGDFCVMIDDTPPNIKPIVAKSNMKGYSHFKFQLSDNFSTEKGIQEFTYEATIDGKWVLFEHDARGDYIKHSFEKDLPAGKHSLELKVTDNRGNSKTYQLDFVR